MNRRLSRLAILLFISDLMFTPIGLLVASRLRVLLPYGLPLGPEGSSLPSPVYLLAMLCWSGSLAIGGAYRLEHPAKFPAMIMRLLWAAFAATVFLAGLLYLSYREVSRLQFIYFLIVNLCLLLSARACLLLYLRWNRNSSLIDHKRIILVGTGDLAQRVARIMRQREGNGYHLLGFLDDDPKIEGSRYEGFPVLGRGDQLLELSKQLEVDEVWSTLPPKAYDRLHDMIGELDAIPVRIKVIPDYFSLALVQAKTEMLEGIPLIGLREPVIDGATYHVKRAFDVLMGAISLVIAAPIMLIIGILIRIESPGPIIFRQTRVGENGRLFGMFKFRTMVENAEARRDEVIQIAPNGDINHKHPFDPRVTRFGAFLRRYSLDELPQLVNVLRGEMSLVGPRPEMPWLVEKYRPWQRKRFAVPQGITGWWQVTGRSDKPMHLNTDEDLFYVHNYSLWLDIKILLKTPLAVIQGKGAF
jgi:exopolysaccharide biosynthesis polyprenyl glycosylphosphotransferase